MGGNRQDQTDIEVVGLGQVCVDYRGIVPFYPQEDSKTELISLFSVVGGPAAVAMMCVSRLGIRTGLIGSIGDDDFGRMILQTLAERGVLARDVKQTSGASTQFALILVTAGSGARTILWTKGSAPHLKAEEVDLGPYRGARILHVDGLMTEAASEAARQAGKMGMTVVMDAGTFRDGSRELVSLVDVLIASETFAVPLVNSGVEDQLLALRALGPREVVITLGQRGSVGLSGGVFYRQKAYGIKALDTTGAGDVYHGAYIYGLLQRWDMPTCMRFASAAAALKCAAPDPSDALPGLEAVLSLMDKQ